MYKLVDSAGVSLKMKDGKPFLYSTKATAQMGKRILESERRTTLTIREA